MVKCFSIILISINRCHVKFRNMKLFERVRHFVSLCAYFWLLFTLLNVFLLCVYVIFKEPDISICICICVLRISVKFDHYITVRKKRVS